MNLNRRSFLTALTGGAILLTDPEELIWRPIRTIFIPPPVTVLTPLICDKLFGAEMEFTWDEIDRAGWEPSTAQIQRLADEIDGEMFRLYRDQSRLFSKC